MKRKIIKLGTATLVASLPSKWIKEFNLKQGDYLDVEERKGELVLSSEKKADGGTEKKIDLKGLNTKLANYYIQAAYTMGYDRIEILHDSQLRVYKSSKNVKTSEYIQKIIERLIGIEIIEQSESRTVLKDLGGISEQEADNILRRIFLLTKWMAPECAKALKEKNREELKAIPVRANNIYKFLNYYRRLLNKRGYKEFDKTAIMYQNLYVLTDVVRVLQYIALEALEMKKNYSGKAINTFETLVSSIEQLDGLFFSFSNEAVMKVMEQRETVSKTIHEESNSAKCTKEDALLYVKLSRLMLDISHLSNGRFHLEL